MMLLQHRALAQLLAGAAVSRSSPPRTVSELAARVGLATRSFQRICKTENVTAKCCVDLVRCLQIVHRERERWDPRALLSRYGLDGRTIDRLVHEGRLDPQTRPTVAEFIEKQRFLSSPKLREALRLALTAGR
jgi:hypothetical protein